MGRMARGVAKSEVEQIGVRLNPLWWLRGKVFRFKQAAIGCLVIFLIVALCVIIGLAANTLQKLFGS